MRFFNHHGLRRLALAVVAMTAVSIGAPAKARQNESQTLAAEVVATMFSVVDFQTLIVKGMEDSSGLAAFNIRPGWSDLLKTSMVEEFDHDEPAIQAIFVRMLVQNLSVEELRAGATLLRDPALREVMAAEAAGRPEPDLKIGKEAERVGSSRAGKAFLRKIGEFDTLFKDAEPEFLAELLPGTFRRFGEKAEANEAARR